MKALVLLVLLPAVARAECPTLAGIDDLLATRTIVVLGELHGTAEIPEALYRFACNAAARKLAVVVGYEMGEDQNAAIDAFFASGDAAPLLTSHYGFGDFGGLGSQAMLDLLRRLRALRQGGADVRFEALNIKRSRAKTPEEQSYEGGMAVRAAQARAHENTFVVMSAGSNHTQSKDGQGIGARLRAMKLPVLALQITTAGGSAWYCDGDLNCQSHSVDADDKGPAWTVRRNGSPDGQHDGTLGVGHVHASPPNLKN